MTLPAREGGLVINPNAQMTANLFCLIDSVCFALPEMEYRQIREKVKG
jgi:hypothetical protein